MAIDDTQKQTFLDALARTGIVADALREAGIKSLANIKRWRETDEQFAAGYEEAEATAADALESEARRRAIEGVQRKRYDKDGNLISEEIVYSDTLMLALLKANKPDKFIDRSKSEISNPDGSLKPSSDTEAAARIAAILEEAKRRRAQAEDADDELFK